MVLWICASVDELCCGCGECEGCKCMACWWYGVEMLRENKRMLDKAIRELDRERQGLQNQEKKLIDEIKKTAKQGQNVRNELYERSCWLGVPRGRFLARLNEFKSLDSWK